MAPAMAELSSTKMSPSSSSPKPAVSLSSGLANRSSSQTSPSIAREIGESIIVQYNAAAVQMEDCQLYRSRLGERQGFFSVR